MKVVVIVCLSLFCAGVCQASTITCTVGDTTQTGVMSCSDVNASSQVTVSDLEYSLVVSAMAYADPVGNGSSASTSLSWSEQIASEGTGPGYMDISLTASGFSFDGFASGSANIGSYFASGAGGNNPVCYGECGLQTVPITLGSIIDIGLSVSAENYVTDDTFGGSAQGQAMLTIAFFAADGVTPVPIDVAPEPASVAMVAMALAGLLGICWRRSALQR